MNSSISSGFPTARIVQARTINLFFFFLEYYIGDFCIKGKYSFSYEESRFLLSIILLHKLDGFYVVILHFSSLVFILFFTVNN